MNLYYKWLITNGLNINNLTIFEKKIKDMGSGLVTKKDIKFQENGNILLELPNSIFITPKLCLESLKKCSCIVNFDSFMSWINFDGLRMLMLFLFHESLLNKESHFYPYISYIPEKYSNMLYFNDCEVNSLPEILREKFIQSRKVVADSYKLIKSDLYGISKYHGYTKDIENLFKWSFSAVNSRCVYCPSKFSLPNNFVNRNVILIPFFDLLNHNFGSKAAITYNDDKNQIELKTFQTFDSGNQVYIDYGPHNNTKLLMEYGFVCENNPNELICLMKVFYRLYDHETILSALNNLKSANILNKDFNEVLCFNVSFDGFSFCSLLLIEIVEKMTSKQSVSIKDIYSWNEEFLANKHKSRLKIIVGVLKEEVKKDLSKLQTGTRNSDNLKNVIQFLKIRLSILNKCENLF